MALNLFKKSEFNELDNRRRAKALKWSTAAESNGVVVPEGYSVEATDWVPAAVYEDGKLKVAATLLGSILLRNFIHVVSPQDRK